MATTIKLTVNGKGAPARRSKVSTMLPVGYVRAVRKGDFLAVVATNEWAAISASSAIVAKWSDWTGLPDESKLFEYVRNAKIARNEVLQSNGDSTGAVKRGGRTLQATYDLAMNTHGSIGPSCAVAHHPTTRSTLPKGGTMHFDCHPVDTSFFDTAPMRFRHEVDLDATAAKVFAIFDDESSWPKWFHAIHKVEWTSGRPHGVGSTRNVTLALATVFEHFFRWEQDHRCTFYLTGTSMPLAHALAEDYLLEEMAPGKTRFTYRVGIEPRMPVAVGGPLSRMYFDSMFKSACEHLQSYVRKV